MWTQLLVTADIMVWLLPHAAWHSGRSLPSRWRLEVAVFAWGKPEVFRRFGGRGGPEPEIENGAEIIWWWWGPRLSLTIIIMNSFARQSLAADSSLTFDLPPSLPRRQRWGPTQSRLRLGISTKPSRSLRTKSPRVSSQTHELVSVVQWLKPHREPQN